MDFETAFGIGFGFVTGIGLGVVALGVFIAMLGGGK
jgi:hypothetical protein